MGSKPSRPLSQDTGPANTSMWWIHDINIYDPLEVEWAMATRFQGDRDMLILPKEPGSSLDPSAEPGTKLTTKIGFDLTAPVGKARSPLRESALSRYQSDKFIS